MDEETAVIAWAYSLLSGLANGRVYDTVAKQGVVGDYLTLNAQSWTEIGTSADGVRGAGRMILTVKAITQTQNDFSRAAALFKAADALLEGRTGISIGINILSCHLKQRIRYAEIKAETVHQHLGGTYVVIVSYQ